MGVESSTSPVRRDQGPCSCKCTCQLYSCWRFTLVDVSTLSKQAQGETGCRLSMHPASVAHLHIISLEMLRRCQEARD